MVTLRLPRKTERALEKAARKQGRTKTALAREAVVGLLEDLDDIAATNPILDRLERGEERTHSADEVKRALGL
jgi:RHH-type rel operon transcriptional repressor/antitoxin RelB